PVQVVYRRVALPVVEIPVSDNAKEALLGATDPRRVRLDLRRSPLLTAYVARDGGTSAWFLALLNHHVVSDHVTLELILGEIAMLLAGRPEALPIPLPYRNFIA